MPLLLGTDVLVGRLAPQTNHGQKAGNGEGYRNREPQQAPRDEPGNHRPEFLGSRHGGHDDNADPEGERRQAEDGEGSKHPQRSMSGP